MYAGRVRAPAAEDAANRPSFSRYVEVGASPPAVANILREAARILTQLGWIQRDAARTAAGHPIHPSRDEACRFSLGGAIVRATDTVSGFWADGCAAAAVFSEVVGMPHITFNNVRGRTLSEIITPLCRAIWRADNYKPESA